MSAHLAALDRPRVGASSSVFKSGPLFISSKGIGWKSWKKRWFILTRTSLVFFKNDPGSFRQRESEVNLTLGGIDLNNSGSVVVREDKKLITVLFPDGRDGRAFTLKAESSEDLYEWKRALDQALSQAPSASLIMGHAGLFQNDVNDATEGSIYHWREKQPVGSMVVGRPILLALEDIDGTPSFLEKALQFIETYGTRIEGVLRQSADVEEVERRVQEYEQGRAEFCPDEDAHVVADCVKHVLRELPSSPVPASCCMALLEAYRFDRKDARINAIRSVIMNAFPEPNMRLLRRLLKMMHTICSHSCDNRMTPPAVAACMAPLLLRPLLDGECGLEGDFYVSGDNCSQLLAAANAANSAQAITTMLLEEYANIFDDGIISRCSVSVESRVGNGVTDDSADNTATSLERSGCNVAEIELCREADYMDHMLSGESSESCCYANDIHNHKVFECDDIDSGDFESSSASVINSNDYFSGRLSEAQLAQNQNQNEEDLLVNDMMGSSGIHQTSESHLSMGDILSSMEPGIIFPGSAARLSSAKPTGKSISTAFSAKRTTFWRRSSGRKTTSMESAGSPGKEELAIMRLEIAKNELQQRIVKEARGNSILQASLERRKQVLHERRFALEQDVSRLQEQLKVERGLRTAMELGMGMPSEQLSNSTGMGSKARAELEEISRAEADVARLKQRAAELHHQLSQQQQNHNNSLSVMCSNTCFAQYDDIPQEKYVQKDVDTLLAHWNHESTQFSEQALHPPDWSSQKELPVSDGVHNYIRPPMQHYVESSGDHISAADSAAPPFSPRPAEVKVGEHTSAASSALVELTTRLDFFKERRSQLIEQLNNLELNYDPHSSQDFIYKPSSPPWK